LGIRPNYEGLEIAPVIPSDWNGFEAHRIFRGIRYSIHVERIGVGNRVQLEVEGKSISGTIIPPPDQDKKTIRVSAYIGEASAL
jgi:cellobiose phosphorylase